MKLQLGGEYPQPIQVVVSTEPWKGATFFLEKSRSGSKASLLMVLFGQVVIGPPGAGKTTYCYGMEQFMQSLGNNNDNDIDARIIPLRFCIFGIILFCKYRILRCLQFTLMTSLMLSSSS